MTACECLKAKAVSELLKDNEADNTVGVIDEMFEGWICSHIPDGLDADNRARVYFTYRELREFLGKIKNE